MPSREEAALAIASDLPGLAQNRDFKFTASVEPTLRLVVVRSAPREAPTDFSAARASRAALDRTDRAALAAAGR